MNKVRTSNPPVITGICGPSESRAQHQHSFKLDSDLKYLSSDVKKFPQKLPNDIKFGSLRLGLEEILRKFENYIERGFTVQSPFLKRNFDKHSKLFNMYESTFFHSS